MAAVRRWRDPDAAPEQPAEGAQAAEADRQADLGHRLVGMRQQLARTLFLTNDRTFRRKLQEAVVSYELEGRLSKDELLELYLNRIFFGAGSYARNCMV